MSRTAVSPTVQALSSSILETLYDKMYWVCEKSKGKIYPHELMRLLLDIYTPTFIFEK